MRYRPQRYDVDELLRGYKPSLFVDGAPADDLVDVAMNGLAFVARAPVHAFEVGRELAIRLEIDREVAYEGRGRVARTVEGAGTDRVRVAVQLLTGFVDVAGLVDKHLEAALWRDLSGGAHVERDGVPAEYREAVEEAVHFLQFHKTRLHTYEEHLRTRDLSGDKTEALVEFVIDNLRGPWLEIRNKLAKTARKYIGPGDTESDNPTMKKGYRLAYQMKRYTESALTSLVIDAPMVERGYGKPLGYPGDYQEMIYVYANKPEGPSVFAKAFHKLGCEEPLAGGVRTRKDLMRRLHEEEHARVLATRDCAMTPFRVTSLACGPAREVREFVEGQPDWPGRVNWTLIDQEEAALSLAYEDTYRALAESKKAGDVRCLFVDFNTWAKKPELEGAASSRDLVYAAGLFDYLNKRTAKQLIAVLFEKVAPGGVLAIGNARVDETNWWFPEFLLDWTLLYRTEADMRDLAEGVEDVVDVDVVLEPSCGYWFLKMRKAE